MSNNSQPAITPVQPDNPTNNNYTLNSCAWLRTQDHCIYLFPSNFSCDIAIYPHPLIDAKPLYEFSIHYRGEEQIKLPSLLPNVPSNPNTPYTLPINNSTWIYVGPLAINIDARTLGVQLDVYATHTDAEPVNSSFIFYDDPVASAAGSPCAPQRPIAALTCPAAAAHYPGETVTITAGHLSAQLTLPNWPAAAQAWTEIVTFIAQRSTLAYLTEPNPLQEEPSAPPQPTHRTTN